MASKNPARLPSSDQSAVLTSATKVSTWVRYVAALRQQLDMFYWLIPARESPDPQNRGDRAKQTSLGPPKIKPHIPKIWLFLDGAGPSTLPLLKSKRPGRSLEYGWGVSVGISDAPLSATSVR